MNTLAAETKEEITKKLNHFPADQIKVIFQSFAKVIINNTDLKFLSENVRKEMEEAVKEETGKVPLCSLDAELSEEEKALYKELTVYAEGDKKITKKKAIEYLTDIIDNDTFLEAFCLVANLPDNMIAKYFDELGCPNRFELLRQDDVFMKRREYVRLIGRYAHAALNLYGCIHVTDFVDIVRSFEGYSKGTEYPEYQKTEGIYKNTVMYTPEYFGVFTVQKILGNILPNIIVSIDGFMAHECFKDEYNKEVEEMKAEFNGKGPTSGEQLSAFTEKHLDKTFRKIVSVTKHKEQYLPGKVEFLNYEDEYYYEKNKEWKDVTDFIEKRFSKQIHDLAEEDYPADRILEDLVDDLHLSTSRRSTNWDNLNPATVLQEAFRTFKEYEIPLSSTQKKEFMDPLMRFINVRRVWINRGFTAAEMYGDKTVAAKKIYPNDPCPCGSGKKYKKCCGRKTC